MSFNSSNHQFTVIGAGPYGMAVASHLRAAGLEVRVFGKPMDFWENQMPKGMLLRSPWSGSNIGDPKGMLTLDRYEAALGRSVPHHIRLEDFVRYGQWFQRQALPDLDTRNIQLVETKSDGFRIQLDDGDSFSSRNIVVAAGIGAFPNCPPLFAPLPKELVSHTSDRLNRDLARFAGKRVIVVGAGQSAMESACLLAEGGAQVEVLLRQQQQRWVGSRPLVEWLMDSKLYPFKAPGKIGPIGLNWLLEHPRLFTRFSRERQDVMAYRAIRPAASNWLRPRLERVTVTLGTHAVAVTEGNGQVQLRLNDGSERSVDHVLLGTGYSIDITRWPFLSPRVLDAVRTVRGYPELDHGFQSSLPGLYFVGATAAYSHGPFFRFVAGSQYAAANLTARVARSTAPATPAVNLNRESQSYR